MGNCCGGNANCFDNNNVGDSNINRMAAGAAMMMTMTAATAVATAVTMAVTMMVVAAVAEAASVAAPMVNAPQPHPNTQQYILIIPFWNSPPTPNNMSYSTRIGIQYKQKIVLIRN